MVQTPPQSKKLVIELPDTLLLQVTPAQFETLALANCDLRLERTATGDLIVNPPTDWETGEPFRIRHLRFLASKNAGVHGKRCQIRLVDRSSKSTGGDFSTGKGSGDIRKPHRTIWRRPVARICSKFASNLEVNKINTYGFMGGIAIGQTQRPLGLYLVLDK
jgi:hypothetical protein